MLAGQFDTRYLETSGTSFTANDIRDRISQPVPVLEVAMGIDYRQGPFELAFGYELASWFNMADRQSFTTESFSGPSSNNTSDLLLDGFFLHAGWTR